MSIAISSQDSSWSASQFANGACEEKGTARGAMASGRVLSDVGEEVIEGPEETEEEKISAGILACGDDDDPDDLPGAADGVQEVTANAQRAIKTRVIRGCFIEDKTVPQLRYDASVVFRRGVVC